jgi:hypothetical protein
MARVRSPNYPQLSLPDAIDRAARVFAKEHRHKAPREVVAQHLGYKGLNGASHGVISALLKYGLLDQEGETLNVTDRTIAILHPSSPTEKKQALIDAARSPALFSELLEQFSGQLPSDENLRSYLIRRGFSPSSLDGVIQVLRETMELVGDEDQHAEASAAPSVGQAPPARAAASAPEYEEMSRPTAKSSVTIESDHLRVSAILFDQAQVARLIQILSANKLMLPDSVEESDGSKDNVD